MKGRGGERWKRGEKMSGEKREEEEKKGREEREMELIKTQGEEKGE